MGRKRLYSIRRLAEAQNWRCVYCSGEMSTRPSRARGATREHLDPSARGGAHGWDNLVAACRACNTVRGHILTPWQFRTYRKRNLYRWPPATRPGEEVVEAFRVLARAVKSRRQVRLELRNRYLDQAMGRAKIVPLVSP